jgi:hypothetical protein
MDIACSLLARCQKCLQNIGLQPEKTRPLGRTENRWEDCSKAYLEAAGGDSVTQNKGKCWAFVTLHSIFRFYKSRTFRGSLRRLLIFVMLHEIIIIMLLLIRIMIIIATQSVVHPLTHSST